MCDRRKGTFGERLRVPNQKKTKEVAKARKARQARKVKDSAPNPKATPRIMALVATAMTLDTLLVNVRRRKRQTMRVPVVEAMRIA